MLSLSLFFVTHFATVVFGDHSYCFELNTTFSDPSIGHEDVKTSEACQALCASSSDCTSFTWFDSSSTAHSEYCELFTSPKHPSSCNNCVSGPRSCMCSGLFSCELNEENLLDIVLGVDEELECAELCYNSSACNFYSWFSHENPTLQLACAFLRDCEGKEESQEVSSGPADCTGRNILKPEYPECFSVGTTWLNIMSSVPNVTSPSDCQNLCQSVNLLTPNCKSFTFFGATATPFRNTCNLYFETKNIAPCKNCVSGPASCTCSAEHGCSIHNEFLLEIVTGITLENDCQQLCVDNNMCTFYTWYSNAGNPFQDACLLLTDCDESGSTCEGCKSGPTNCENTETLPNYPNTIVSPNYPSVYPNNVLEYWTVRAPNNFERIEFLFDDFYTESVTTDWVTLTDSDGTEIFKHGGHAFPDPYIIQSNTDEVTVEFQSDFSGQEKGFRMFWRVIRI